MAAKKSTKIVGLIILLVVLVAAFLLIKVFSNDFTTDIKTFYAKVDDQIITTNQTNMRLLGKTIEVRSITDVVNQDNAGFKWEIVRNSSSDNFNFYVDGKQKTFSETKDFSKGFAVEVTKDSIRIKPTTLLAVLQKIYQTENIQLPETVVNSNVCYFTLRLLSSDGTKELKFDFVAAVDVENFTLDKEQVVF